MTDYQLAGKVVLVTGAAQGIGLGIARRFAAEGCRLVMNDVNEEALAEAAATVAGQDDKPFMVTADVADEAAVNRMFETVAGQLGGVEVLVNNAALTVGRKWLPEQTAQHFERVIRVNVHSIHLCSRAAARQMAPRGDGAIINLSSVAGARAFRANVSYVTSKGAVEALTRALALDLAPYGIRVNAIGPGSIDTESWDGLSPEAVEHRSQLAPLGRAGRPDDVASAAVFLASAEAGYITGQVLYVDGGLTTQLYTACAEVPHLGDPPPEPYPLE